MKSLFASLTCGSDQFRLSVIVNRANDFPTKHSDIEIMLAVKYARSSDDRNARGSVGDRHGTVSPERAARNAPSHHNMAVR